MGSRSLSFWHFAFSLAFATGCASKLVDVDDIQDDVPKEFSQSMTDLGSKVVDASQTAGSGDQQGLVDKAPEVVSPSKTILPKPDHQKIQKAPKTKSLKKSSVGWQPQKWPFGVGEFAEYSLRYGVIEGGVITMKVLEPKVVDGDQALHYYGSAKSTKLLELFYRVDNTIESWVTMDSHLPIRQEIDQRESAQWGKRVVTFDRKNQTSKFFATTERPKKKKKVDRISSKLEYFAQDLFGAMYFWRFIEPKERVNFAVHDRGKAWSNETIYLGTETLDLPVGKTRARRYKMNPRIQGHLKPRGDVEAWFSDDERRIMVRFRAHLKFGSITGDLRKFIPGKQFTIEPPHMKTPIDLDSMGVRK